MDGSKFPISFNLFLRGWVGKGLGALLLAAAILKLSRGAAFHPLDLGGRVIPWMEILLSFWLISGACLEWALGVASSVFFCFALLTLWMVVRGVADCGCFGAVSISPKVTYWIDLAALLAAIGALGLIRFRLLLAAVLLPGGTLYLGALVLADDHQTSPKMEVGKLWSLAGAVDCSADLSRGRWIVLIYSSDCGHCQSLAADYARDAAEWFTQGKKIRLALLDAHDTKDSEAIFPPSGVVRGRLLQADLYHHTPILLLLDDGRVLAVHEGWEVADWSYPPFSSWVR